ncbi:MAG: DNA polymerase/3'-5' exonuclease PolX [Gammaproteobacteria bacterium]|nr:DNA polymerase/3'-5' exonuclease PolX [Rhodocyclaceae bacterium]MBU3909658.1 DNA polymerase/3'-5' exonuclease PolX [Gammaproteobacteria bacterium]MBU3987973.1 DNA polymerase/3'-5' exonuclease PolX [Gammaproteobacteria bacterium]MBU4005191.1 DNA polymerase/3'-5' exonuclease PolX [Gammaproteobacteria bacterium]MBU4022370.1 DNA polymerase/3'-5' exonuclease PolX [Gammaproteobacteria bacterium]
MPTHNADIAAIFTEIADLLEIEQANPFRIRAYRNAARNLGEMGREVRALVERGEDLTQLPGIGADLAAKLGEIVATGKCRTLEKLHTELPPTITDLLHVPGLGPKRVRTLWHDLDIQTAEQLARAAQDGRIRGLPGFGAKTEANILQAVAAQLATARRIKLATAAQYAESLVAWLGGARGVERVEVAGSYRRCRETVGDLDILAVAAADSDVMARLKAYDEVGKVLALGPTRASVVLKSGLQVDLRVVAAAAYGAALCYFTGSKAHNIALRRMAQERGLKLNEYGVFRGKERIAGDSEAAVYRSFDLPWIPPELREDRGEIAAARAGRLPKLVEPSDLRGDLHAHTKATDGHHTLEEMARAAKALGHAYLAITEHSRRLAMAHGLDPRRLAEQCDAIDRLNASLDGIVLLKGIEVDILDDGSLDLPDSSLARLDLVIGAVHSRFDLSRAKQTERILRAMDHPYFTLLAHPTGRLIETRAPYDVDMLRIIRHAKQRGCYLELNAHPERLDLLDTHCLMAKEEGVLVAINSDAHSRDDLANLRFGVGQARRGWLAAADVLNTRPLPELRRLLAQVRG